MNSRPIIVAALGWIVVIGGCQEKAKVSRDAVLADYSAGRYSQSLAGAQELASKGSGSSRDEARYIAGISAYRLGQRQEALRHLLPLTRLSDPAVAGPASATVGLIYTEMKLDEQAMRYLRSAADKVSGEDRAQVQYHMGLIEQRAGHWRQAQTHFSLAQSYTRDPTLRKALAERVKSDGFALQFGAFAEASGADRLAKQLRPTIDRASIGTIRVVPSISAAGKQLYLVQAGHFTTHAAAVSASQRVASAKAIIVPAIR